MKQFLITVAGVFVGLCLFMIGLPILLVALVVGAAQPTPIAARSVLVLDLRGPLTDQETLTPFAILQGRALSVMAIEEGLRRAEGDGKVSGLLVRLPEGGMAPAAADELRLAFKRFRAAGKPILVHGQGLYAQGWRSRPTNWRPRRATSGCSRAPPSRPPEWPGRTSSSSASSTAMASSPTTSSAMSTRPRSTPTSTATTPPPTGPRRRRGWARSIRAPSTPWRPIGAGRRPRSPR